LTPKGRRLNAQIWVSKNMNVSIRYRLACLSLFVCTSPLLAAEPVRFIDAHSDAIESFLNERFGDSNSGMVIGLLDQHASRIFAAGTLDNGTDQRVDGNTVFEIGSVTKVFTALLLLDAVRRGEMQLDDPVAKYLPAHVPIPNYGGTQVTLRNLAAQESGLPFHPDNLAIKPVKELTLKELKEGSDAYTSDKLYTFVSSYKLTQAPGTRFEYSNVGMALLGHALERRTGLDYETLVVDRICRPLGMNNTLISQSREIKARLARGHSADGARSEHLQLRVMASAGGLLSTTNDLLKFLSANLGLTKTYLTPLMEQMQVIRHTGSPMFGKTAMPWVDAGVYSPPGTQLLGHAGGGFGNVAFIAFDSKRGRGVVVLTNQMNVHPGDVGWSILQGIPLSENSTPVREVIGIGIGLEMDLTTGMLRITTVYPKSPAGRAELRAGLVIRAINGTSIEGRSLEQCLGMIKGPPGSNVRLEIIDPQRMEMRILELTRQKFLTAPIDFPDHAADSTT
jgi:CubicO group peptidase (beta-lactamase class C family)